MIDIKNLEQAIQVYQLHHGTYPTTDNQSTWYEKLTGGYPGGFVSNETPDHRFPLDYYNYQLIFEPPSTANGGLIVVRSVGENGIDDQGALDDWDSRYGPNLGYWYKSNWPAIYLRASICGVLAVLGLVAIMIKVNGGLPKIAAIMVWLGFLAGVVLPWGIYWRFHSPAWYRPSIDLGIFILPLGIIMIGVLVVKAIVHKRALRLSGTIPCAKCHYDLRGTIAANIDRCPECGEPVGDVRA